MIIVTIISAWFILGALFGAAFGRIMYLTKTPEERAYEDEEQEEWCRQYFANK